MRKWIATILLGCILTQLFYSSGFLIDYYTNTDSYKALCENKDRPQLNCDGKCILAQKITAAQTENSEKEDADIPPIPVISLKYLPSAFHTEFGILFTPIVHNGDWIEPFIRGLTFSIFKPPS